MTLILAGAVLGALAGYVQQKVAENDERKAKEALQAAAAASNRAAADAAGPWGAEFRPPAPVADGTPSGADVPAPAAENRAKLDLPEASGSQGPAADPSPPSAARRWPAQQNTGLSAIATGAATGADVYAQIADKVKAAAQAADRGSPPGGSSVSGSEDAARLIGDTDAGAADQEESSGSGPKGMETGAEAQASSDKATQQTEVSLDEGWRAGAAASVDNAQVPAKAMDSAGAIRVIEDLGAQIAGGGPGEDGEAEEAKPGFREQPPPEADQEPVGVDKGMATGGPSESAGDGPSEQQRRLMAYVVFVALPIALVAMGVTLP